MMEVVCYIFIKSLVFEGPPKLGIKSMHFPEALANNPIYRYKKGVNIPYSSVSFCLACLFLLTFHLPFTTFVQFVQIN